MQFSRKCAGAAAMMLLATTLEASPNSLKWRPHEFDDVQALLADDATGNLASAVAAEHNADPKPHSVHKDPVVKLGKRGVQSQNKFANPLLDSYLGESSARPAGSEFTTQWNVKAKAVGSQQVSERPREIPDEANAYIRDLHGEAPTSLKEKFATRRAAARTVASPKVPTMPLSKVLGSDMKAAVVTAEEWEEEDRTGKQTSALNAATRWGAAATRWGSAHLRGPDASLAAGRVAVTAGASAGQSDSNPYMTLLGATQATQASTEAAAGSKNPYFSYFRSDKEIVQDEVSAAEKQATKALDRHHGGNSYLNSVIPDSIAASDN